MLSRYAVAHNHVGRCLITGRPITREQAQRDLALLAGLVAAGMPAGPVARRRKELREMVRRGR